MTRVAPEIQWLRNAGYVCAKFILFAFLFAHKAVAQQLITELKYDTRQIKHILVWEYVPADGGVVIAIMKPRKGLTLEKYDQSHKLQWEIVIGREQERKEPVALMVIKDMIYLFFAETKGIRYLIYLWKVKKDNTVLVRDQELFEVKADQIVPKISYSPNREWGAMFLVERRLLGAPSRDSLKLSYYLAGPAGESKGVWRIPQYQTQIFGHPTIDNQGNFYAIMTTIDSRKLKTDLSVLRYVPSHGLTLAALVPLPERNYANSAQISLTDTVITLAALIARGESEYKDGKPSAILLSKIKMPGFFVANTSIYQYDSVRSEAKTFMTEAAKALSHTDMVTVQLYKLYVNHLYPQPDGKYVVVCERYAGPSGQSLQSDYRYDISFGNNGYNVGTKNIYLFLLDNTGRIIKTDTVKKSYYIITFRPLNRQSPMMDPRMFDRQLPTIYETGPYILHVPMDNGHSTSYSLFRKGERLYFLYVSEYRDRKDDERLYLTIYDMKEGKIVKTIEVMGTEYERFYKFYRPWTRQVSEDEFIAVFDKSDKVSETLIRRYRLPSDHAD